MQRPNGAIRPLGEDIVRALLHLGFTPDHLIQALRTMTVESGWAASALMLAGGRVRPTAKGRKWAEQGVAFTLQVLAAAQEGEIGPLVEEGLVSLDTQLVAIAQDTDGVLILMQRWHGTDGGLLVWGQEEIHRMTHEAFGGYRSLFREKEKAC